MTHVPVLLNEVIDYLNLGNGKKIIDATIDGGGHTREILSKFPEVKVLGIEWDPELYKGLKPSENLKIINDSYVNIKIIVEENDFKPDGILFDLGLSSWHYEGSGRGFSFKRDEPLDMRFNPQTEALTAANIVNGYSVEELKKIIEEYGEEKFAESIARSIAKHRDLKRIATTVDLLDAIGDGVPEWYKHRKIHFATKTFQALRVVVNDELGNVRKGMMSAIDILNSGGRLVVISFQGLEDKIVKEIFKENIKNGILKTVVNGTVKPSWEETRQNPRARSAKMKVVEKI